MVELESKRDGKKTHTHKAGSRNSTFVRLQNVGSALKGDNKGLTGDW